MSEYLWICLSIAVADIETPEGKRLRKRLLDGDVKAEDFAKMLADERGIYSDCFVEAIDDEKGRFERREISGR